jgi:hypothetical protein
MARPSSEKSTAPVTPLSHFLPSTVAPSGASAITAAPAGFRARNAQRSFFRRRRRQDRPKGGEVPWEKAVRPLGIGWRKAARSQGAAHLDPIALEERLKVARALRAEALARRASDPRPHPGPRLARALRPDPLPEPAPRLIPARPDPAAAGKPADAPPPAASSPTRPAPTRGRSLTPLAASAPAGLPAASPIARGALALGFAGSLVLTRETPGVPAAPPPAQAAAALVAPLPPTRRPPRHAAAAEPAPLRRRRARCPCAAAGLPPPCIGRRPPPRPRPSPKQATAPHAAPPLPRGRRPRPGAPRRPRFPAPRRSRRSGRCPPCSSTSRAASPARAVEPRSPCAARARRAEVVGQPTNLTIAASTVRFYHLEDAAAAAEIATIVAPHLPGGRAEPRDFTSAASRAAPGNLEIWVAGGRAPARLAPPPACPSAASSRPPSAGRHARTSADPSRLTPPRPRPIPRA